MVDNPINTHRETTGQAANQSSDNDWFAAWPVVSGCAFFFVLSLSVPAFFFSGCLHSPLSSVCLSSFFFLLSVCLSPFFFLFCLSAFFFVLSVCPELNRLGAE